MDYYNKPDVPLDTSIKVGKKLQSYGIVQSSISFFSPLLTINRFNADSSVNSNFHLLVAGTAYWLKPQLKGIEDHTLAKYGLGVRAIYNTGKKSIFFFEWCPFVTQDITYGGGKSTSRVAGTMLWSYSASPRFAFRLGATKSFLWGNRYYLPFVGFRVGRLDKVNFSIQFPRNMSLNIPVSQRVRMSVFSKPQGGVFNFSNRDTVYNQKKYDTVLAKTPDRNIFFGRYELLTGFRFDIVPLKWLSFYVATGFSTRNFAAFYSENFNRHAKAAYGEFYATYPKNTVFFNFGVTVRLGRTKSYYGNYNMYEAADINKTFDPGENNVNPGPGDIPVSKKKIPGNLKPSEVQDLIDANDF